MRVLSSLKSQAPGRQPLGEPRLDLARLVPGVAQGDQIVGVSDQAPGSPQPSNAASLPVALVTDSGGLLHPMQSHVQQQRG